MLQINRMNRTFSFVILFVIFASAIAGQTVRTPQVPLPIAVRILRAEDERRYDRDLKDLLRSTNSAIRARAALAAGRIGSEEALPDLIELLTSDTENDVRAVAAFAIGEIESVKGADAILKLVSVAFPADRRKGEEVIARAVEAAGKIAAANPKDPLAADLGRAIVGVLDSASARGDEMDRTTVLLALTAALRARPDNADLVIARFLSSSDARIRADAANALTRLRSKNANETLRQVLAGDPDAVARSNAARALGAAEDKDALDLLVKAAVSDPDPRVRVSAIRSVAALKVASSAHALIERAGYLLIPKHGDPAPLRPGQKAGRLSPVEVPLPKSELLEIAVAVGRLLPGTDDPKALAFLRQLRRVDRFSSAETEIAFARVAPKLYIKEEIDADTLYVLPYAASAYAQGLGEIATLKSEELNARAGERLTSFITGMARHVAPRDQKKMIMAMPDMMRATAALKPDNLDELLRGEMTNEDVFIRAAAAELLAERPNSKDNFAAIERALTLSMLKDKHDNDAILAMMDALAKLDKPAAVGSLLTALSSPDHLVRRRAFQLLDDPELAKTSPGLPSMLKAARDQGKDRVRAFSPSAATRLGQVLSSDVDYRRALSRRNGSVRAVVKTEKGSFTIVLDPEEAPLTVDNWIRLARMGYFDGLIVHRVVPNFVMQDGDPRGDGNGGPGWSIRCEVNMLPYDRGAVGMALSGKDTGGSQWFVTHSPQPHLDGGYTVFGKVNEKDMRVVDAIVRGDRIISVRIIGR